MQGWSEDIFPGNVSETVFPQWRCYAKLVNPQHIFLTFLPATFPGKALPELKRELGGCQRKLVEIEL